MGISLYSQWDKHHWGTAKGDGGLGKETAPESCSKGGSHLLSQPTQTSTPQESDRKGALYAHFKSEEADALGNGNLQAFHPYDNFRTKVNIEMEQQ